MTTEDVLPTPSPEEIACKAKGKGYIWSETEQKCLERSPSVYVPSAFGR